MTRQRKNLDRYLAIVDWSRARYGRNGSLVISIGHNPTRFKIIEDMAGEKYVGFNRLYPDHNLKTAVKVES